MRLIGIVLGVLLISALNPCLASRAPGMVGRRILPPKMDNDPSDPQYSKYEDSYCAQIKRNIGLDGSGLELTLLFAISKDGQVVAPTIFDSSGSRQADVLALEALLTTPLASPPKGLTLDYYKGQLPGRVDISTKSDDVKSSNLFVWAIPLQACQQYPAIATRSKLMSSSNRLYLVKPSKNDYSKKTDIRAEDILGKRLMEYCAKWKQFFEMHHTCSYQELKAESELLRKEFADVLKKRAT